MKKIINTMMKDMQINYNSIERGNYLIRQKYLDDNYIISIEEDEQAYFYAMKDREDIYCALIIRVHKSLEKCKKGEYLGYYHKVWSKEVSVNTINSFIKNILEKPEFRKDYLYDGNGFEGIISYTNENGVNKKCQQAISKFYSIKASKRRFKDYIALKTYGIDKFSRMKLDKLEELLKVKDVELAKSAFDDEKLVLSVLRWCCRGLLIDDAIRKVKTDLEVANNIR